MRATVVFVVALVLVAACMRVAAEDAAPESPKPQARKLRSLFQACRDDIKRLCKQRRGVLNCIEKNATNVENEVCAAWLKARAACKADVEKSSCATTPFRACLMKLDTDSLTTDCSESDFYKSVRRTRNLINKRRAAAGAGTTGTGGGAAAGSSDSK
uniref:IMS import disulfide relay-system CHCH-CHCH-like Cx9C domain-containing protein n=1 Tax=Neobodo designis TaxID=312471 RepID=A0A7S1MIV5_NEODS|mmetsp:Transcript_41349/g.127805  ORF Transcript_41349/g.127805 Transcript_41349/m.127805 type:complete len:157 (+) Transcript_41349:49-519(+)